MQHQDIFQSNFAKKAVAIPSRAFGHDSPSSIALNLYSEPSVKLFDLELVNGALVDVAKKIVSGAVGDERATIAFINAHCVNVAVDDPAYCTALDEAQMLLPDGSGIHLAAKLAGKTPPENLNGTDLFPHLCAEAQKQRKSIFLLGGKPGIASLAARNMQAQFPQLEIAGTLNGYFDSDREDEIVETINGTGADILLVGFGVPLQEKWIARNRKRLSAKVVAAVGGLFDYYSNSIPRAPVWMRKIGGEWVWRLVQEPSRLAGRYIKGNIVFVAHALVHAYASRGLKALVTSALKRMMDISIAASALLLLSPLIMLICLTIFAQDKSSPFFRQTRIGHKGRSFKMWKFRSMCVGADKQQVIFDSRSERDSVCFKMKQDPRITRIGRFLRRSSLDELPQLINVLAGDMSLVGPRPALPTEVLKYPPHARKRMAGKPGITCIWQVSGRATLPFKKQVEMDIEYLSKPSVLRDIGLLFKTVPAVLAGKGAY